MFRTLSFDFLPAGCRSIKTEHNKEMRIKMMTRDTYVV